MTLISNIYSKKTVMIIRYSHSLSNSSPLLYQLLLVDLCVNITVIIKYPYKLPVQTTCKKTKTISVIKLVSNKKIIINNAEKNFW